MKEDNPNAHAHYVNRTFQKVAPHYDLMNRLITFGFDLSWRKELVSTCQPYENGVFLDLGTGTGDIAREVHRQYRQAKIFAADFTIEMLLTGKKWDNIIRLAADAQHIPTPEGWFDVVMSGFLMRNITDRQAALAEMFRVLKPGGKLLILDTTRPRKNLFSPLTRLYLKYVIPFIGALLTRQREAYTYLPSSTEHFISAEQLSVELEQAGFINITFKIRMFGTIALHQAQKSAYSSTN